MSVEFDQVVNWEEGSFQVNWRNGIVDVPQSQYIERSSGGVEGMECKLADAGRAVVELDTVFRSAHNGINSMLSLIPHAINILGDLKTSGNWKLRKHTAKQLDMFLEQIGDLARDSDIAGVNMLHNESSRVSIPYFLCDVVISGERHHFSTLGIGVSTIREEVEEGLKAFVGLYVVSSAEKQPVLWLKSLNFWMENQELDSVDEDNFIEEIEDLENLLLQLQWKLVQTESQFTEYTKMVGNKITDHLKIA